MRLNVITLALACVVSSVPTSAVAAAPAAVAVSPVPDNALRLSRLLNPTDKLVDVAMRGFDVGVHTALKNNPEDAAIYDQNPGLLDAIVEAGKPIVRRHVEADVPLHQQKFAEFYARKFSSAEIEQLIAFYSTPTGTKVIDGMYAGADLGQIADALGKKGDEALTPTAVRDLTRSTGEKLFPGFDADDWKALFTFAGTPAYAKLQSSVPELRQLTADIADEPDPGMDAELNKAVEATVTKYMAEKRARQKS